MTSEQRYKLVFNGQILEGFEAKAVQKSLAKALKLGDTQLKTLFSGRLITVRKGLDPAQAEKFRAVLERAGARVHVHVDSGDEAATVQSAPAAATAAALSRAPGKLQAAGKSANAAAREVAMAEAKPTAKSDPASAVAKPVAKSAPAKVTATPAAVSDTTRVSAKPAAKDSDKGPPATQVTGGGELECPRCAHRQPVSEQCVHCRMDLRRHLRKLERRAKLRERRRQAGVG